ncbi:MULTISPECIES: helix-turn-helix transcriptional regulator [unclassified Aeromicrobium]|uniref:helix-turn-helix transcriptional regulator n=1 Tax=unclassified Aeromicrobium TaxID=2633570 RepID=UPI0006F6C8BD|nr:MULTISPECIES: helix-turn-helix transcriptional regulator [unclassified Aeromicrobium]KQO42779.1 XRE family transcriptional regulator [Aeromicrobium sp. Leaf245]KQP83525.1 XRE family transcriptional regulator [Aeromicrobium sp. Leaf291]
MTTDGRPADPREELRAQIREFLSTRRARITPAQAGLPAFGGERRRVAGLRREEVAVLAGVSPQYYIRFERGDATGVSDSIIDGVAHALQLDAAERAHLLDLLRAASAPRRAAARRKPSGPVQVRPAIQRLLDSMSDSPAMVMNGRLDVLAANAAGRALFSPVYDYDGEIPNTALYVFLGPDARRYFRDWEKVASDTVSILRAEAGRDPHDRDVSDLVGRLSTCSDEFRVRWAAHDVMIHSHGVKRFHHPIVGDLDLPFETLPLGDSVTSVVAYTAEPGSPSHDAVALLSSWTADETDKVTRRS